MNDLGDPALRFVPTIERARASLFDVGPVGTSPELLQHSVEERRFAAILIVARVLRREAWEEPIEMSERRAATMGTEIPEVPASYVEQSAILRVSPALELRDCSMCDVRKPGFTACATCGGSGRDSLEGAPCPGCGGERFIVCSVCEGAKRTVRIRVRHVSDRDVSLRDLFLPKAIAFARGMFGFESTLSGAIAAEATPPPEELRFDLFATETSSAYRGVQRRVDPTFRGFAFEDALERARTALRGMAGKGTVVRYEFAAYAFPLLWLREKSSASARAVVIFTRRDGEVCRFAPANEASSAPPR